MSPRLLLMAKAPVPGLAKTRLGAVVGTDAAADLAAAALLDTIEACTAAFADCSLALAGDLALASRGAEIAGALAGWSVFGQHGSSFGDRLAHAHAHLGADVVQVGMDTPQLTPGLLLAAAAGLAEHDAVLGPAEDGGWWVLALRDGGRAAVLGAVPMSTADTFEATSAALGGGGASVGTTALLRDVDTFQDAVLVAADAPWTRFARTWSALSAVAS